MKGVVLVAGLLLLHGIVNVVCFELTSPTPVSSTQSTAATWSLDLHVRVARHQNEDSSFTSRQYCYQGTCSIPGPTIQVRPGDVLTINLYNDLVADASEGTMNELHSPNTTNLHTHGLHVAPQEDDVISPVYGGTMKAYTYHIPSNHAPGMHWYHGHFHGSSSLHMQSGMVGALEVLSSSLPSTITTLYSSSVVAVFTSHKFAFDTYSLNGVDTGLATTDCAGPPKPREAYDNAKVASIDELSTEAGSSFLSNYVSVSNRKEVYLVNGHWQPTITLQAGASKVVRMINAAGSHTMKMKMAGAYCIMTVIAADGVFFSAPRVRPTLYLIAGARYDVVFECSQSDSLVVYYGDAWFAKWNHTLITFTTSGSGTSIGSLAAPLTTLYNARPTYLADQRGIASSALAYNQVQFSQNNIDCKYWTGMGPNCEASYEHIEEPSTTSTNCAFRLFPGSQGGNGTRYNPPSSSEQYIYTTVTNKAQEWRIYNDGEHQHPFHMHVYHFQIISHYSSLHAAELAELPAGNTYSEFFDYGEFRDTIGTLDGAITIRFTPMDFYGEVILHCHWLRHEDMGMMSSYYVCDETSTGGLVANGCPAPLLNYTSTSTTSTGGTSTGGGGGTGGNAATSLGPLVALQMIAIVFALFISTIAIN